MDNLKIERINELLELARGAAVTYEPSSARGILKILAQHIDFYNLKNLKDDKLRVIVAYCYFSLLPVLDKEKIYDLFLLLFDCILKDEILDIEEIIERFKLKIVSMPAGDEEFFRKMSCLFLCANDKIISQTKVGIHDKKIAPGTIKNWLEDFLYYIRNSDKEFNYTVSRYFSENTNFRSLSEQEKRIVKKLVIFFLFISDSPYSLASSSIVDTIIETPDGRLNILSSGKIIEVFGPSSGLINKSGDKLVKIDGGGQEPSGEQAMFVFFQNFTKSPTMVKILSIKNSFSNNLDVKVLRSHFYQAVNEGKVEEAVAALLLLAENGKLKEAFAGDERFVKFWSDYLVKNNLDKSGFDKDPANGRDLARFLKYILEGRLKMKPEEAAMLGILTANLAREAGELVYKALAYGDMETGEFRWNI